MAPIICNSTPNRLDTPSIWVLPVQVQDVPTTINHVHAEGRRWVFDLEDELHTRFTGTAIELAPRVLMQAAFHDGDVYQWHKVGKAPAIQVHSPAVVPGHKPN